MATVLESITVSRSSTLSSVAFSPLTASSISSLSTRCNSAKVLQYRGLKLRPIAANRFSGSGIDRRVGRIVCEAPNTAVEAAPITDADWQSLVLESESPVLVEFWAPWCGPCRMIHPIIDELAKQYARKLKCYKINTDDSSSTASRYGIRSIPTVMIFKNGEKKDAVVGAVPKSTLITSIEKFL